MTKRECTRCRTIRTIRARGLCGSCYNRISLYGDTAPDKVNRTADEWMVVLDRTPGQCWLWPGRGHSHGYGSAKADGKWRLAHRYVYSRLVGVIPDGMTLDHLCKNKLCVNPEHLEVVTRAENLRRAVSDRTTQKPRVPRCTHGDEDLYVDPSGKRVCRICRRERTRLWRSERKETLGHY